MSFYDYDKEPEQLTKGLNNIGYLIKLLDEELLNLIDAQMQVFELTASQWRPIILVALSKANTPAELARLTDVDTGAMTRTLDRLEKKNFIIRTRSDEDRRIVLISLTDKGNQVATHLMPVLEDCLNKALKGFSKKEFALFKYFLIKMLGNLSPETLNDLEILDGKTSCNIEAITSKKT